MTPETNKLRTVEDLVYETLCEINAKSNCGCGGYIDYDVEVPMLTKVITRDRQQLLNAVCGVLDSKNNEFVPADQVWEGDEEQEVGEWKFVPKEDGMYCLNCERFIHEEGCLCGMISIEDAKSAIKNLLDVNK